MNYRLQKICRHIWRKDYPSGGKICRICGKKVDDPIRSTEVEP